MTIPLVLLAIPSVLIGFLGFPPENGLLHHFLEPVFTSAPAEAAHDEVASLYALQEDPAEETHEATTTGPSSTEPAGEHGAAHAIPLLGTIVFGIISTVVAAAGIALARRTYGEVRDGDDILARDRALTRGLHEPLYNKWYWDERYNRWFVKPARELAMTLWQVVDIGMIDATVNGVATGIGALSQRLRHVQTGLVANYALAIALGMVVIVGVYLGLFSSLFR
jgi:NADH-quinone oxidoreductase subunit L